jgi:ankyrin repeat protein
MPKGTKSKGANRKKSSSPLPAWVAYVAVLAVALALVLLLTERPESTEACATTVSGYACVAWGENEWGLDPASTTCEQVDGLARPWCFHNADEWDYCSCPEQLPRRGSGGSLTLRQAAELGDTTLIRRLIEAGEPLNKPNDDGDTTLILAARAGQAEAVTALIEGGAEVDSADSSGFTALMSAALVGHTAAAKALIDGGANTELKEPNGWTALHQAARYGHSDTIRALVGVGATIDKKTNDGWSALTVAAYTGETEAARVLLELGAAARMQLPDGSVSRDTDPLWISTAFGHCEVAKAIVATAGSKASVNSRDADGNTALMSAARHERPECLSVLVELGADVDAQNHNGWTALMDAAWNGKEKSVKVLLDLGADTLLEENAGRTARACALKQKHKRLGKLIRDAEKAQAAQKGDGEGDDNDPDDL